MTPAAEISTTLISTEMEMSTFENSRMVFFYIYNFSIEVYVQSEHKLNWDIVCVCAKHK